MGPTDGGLPRDPPGLGGGGGDLEAFQFRDSNRRHAGVVFLDFTLQICGRGFDREPAGVALSPCHVKK